VRPIEQVRLCCFAALILAGSIAWLEDPSLALAQQASSPRASLITVRSKHFLVHTDLNAARITPIVDQLETLVANLTSYWGRPLSGRIECYIAGDLKQWPDGLLEPEGREKIAEKAGATLTERLSRDGEVISIHSTVYAYADGRTPLHEAVHAFCWQTFGRCGPDWFAEGMAEVGAYWHDGDTRVRCPTTIERYLRTATPLTPGEIIGEHSPTRPLWQTYAQRWALCYLLVNHPRYSERFRQFGRSLLRGEEVDFQEAFADVAEPLAADHRQFLRRVNDSFDFATTKPQ
jgi:hypothetical protein